MNWSGVKSGLSVFWVFRETKASPAALWANIFQTSGNFQLPMYNAVRD